MLSFFTFIIAMMLILPLMKSAARLSFIDSPGERKVHSIPISRSGGIARVAGVVTPVLMWVERARRCAACSQESSLLREGVNAGEQRPKFSANGF